MVMIQVDTLKSAEELVQLLGHVNDAFDVHQGRYIVNGKSIMGICSLDLDAPMFVTSPTMKDLDLLVLLQHFDAYLCNKEDCDD